MSGRFCHRLLANMEITEVGIRPWRESRGGWRKLVVSKHLYLNGCFDGGGFYHTRRTLDARKLVHPNFGAEAFSCAEGPNICAEIQGLALVVIFGSRWAGVSCGF
jgi:hypothetical protein